MDGAARQPVNSIHEQLGERRGVVPRVTSTRPRRGRRPTWDRTCGPCWRSRLGVGPTRRSIVESRIESFPDPTATLVAAPGQSGGMGRGVLMPGTVTYPTRSPEPVDIERALWIQLYSPHTVQTIPYASNTVHRSRRVESHFPSIWLLGLFFPQMTHLRFGAFFSPNERSTIEKWSVRFLGPKPRFSCSVFEALHRRDNASYDIRHTVSVQRDQQQHIEIDCDHS